MRTQTVFTRRRKLEKKPPAKVRITISIPTKIIQWIDQRITEERFDNYSHAFRYGILCAQREDELRGKVAELERIIEELKRKNQLKDVV